MNEELTGGCFSRSDPAAIRIIPGRAGQKYGRKNKPVCDRIPSYCPSFS